MTKLKPKPKATDIDAFLPQTQCGLCDHPGCLPYANAIISNNESIDRCLPGGVKTLKKIADYLNIDPGPYLDEMAKKSKPASVAIIREESCIGCTKCIQACPVDAIIGASKQMHTVIRDACTGCELCIAPCPVDCIDILPIPEPNEKAQVAMADQSRQRYLDRQARLIRHQKKQKQRYQQAKLAETSKPLKARQAAIQAAIARVQAKKAKMDE